MIDLAPQAMTVAADLFLAQAPPQTLPARLQMAFTLMTHIILVPLGRILRELLREGETPSCPCPWTVFDKELVAEVIAANPTQVEQFRAGKQQVLGFLVGQVMKASRGKANPQQVNEALRRALGG